MTDRVVETGHRVGVLVVQCSAVGGWPPDRIEATGITVRVR